MVACETKQPRHLVTRHSGEKRTPAGSWSPEAIRRGWQAVRDLQDRMDEGRRRRLAFIGFPDDEAAELSALHTRNFM